LILAIDGGAFQQGIAGGILNVQVGLMNALGRLRPDMSFVLVADSRLHPIRAELTKLLDAVPSVVVGEVGPAYGGTTKKLLSRNACVRYRIDGKLVDPILIDGLPIYEGPPPRTSFQIVSSSFVPRETLGQSDTRILGVCFTKITIGSDTEERIVRYDEPALRTGFNEPGPGHRWTKGDADIPLLLFPTGATKIRFSLERTDDSTYPIGDGIFDRSYFNISDRITRLNTRTATALLEEQLLNIGVRGYIANHFIPAHFREINTYAILYDIIPILFPGFFNDDALENFGFNMGLFKRANHIFSISEASRIDLVNAGVPASRITNVWIDAAPIFRRQSKSAVSRVRAGLGLFRRPYILSVGTLEPRKNHARLIEAFALISSAERNVDLVLVGKAGWGTGDLHQQISRLGLGADVRICSDVSNEVLAALYSGAMFLAYPSLYEGFGLPVVEAMACGCPVLTSDTSSMPEIAGDAAIFVDPTDVASIAAGLRKMMSSANLRTRLAERGFRRRTMFDWRKTAQKVAAVLDADVKRIECE
jgi:glycosyltransferase involved in cell wall biosynthesis